MIGVMFGSSLTVVVIGIVIVNSALNTRATTRNRTQSSQQALYELITSNEAAANEKQAAAERRDAILNTTQRKPRSN